jgi:hypothetical protein
LRQLDAHRAAVHRGRAPAVVERDAPDAQRDSIVGDAGELGVAVEDIEVDQRLVELGDDVERVAAARVDDLAVRPAAEIVIDAEVALPRDPQPTLGEPRDPSLLREVADIPDSERQRFGHAAAAEDHVGTDERVLAELERLPDRLRAQPELVGVRARRNDHEQRDDEPVLHRATVTVATFTCDSARSAATPHAPTATAR